MRQIFGEIAWGKKTAIYSVAVIFLTILGPFGTYEALGFTERFIFWVVIFFGVGFFMHIAMTLALGSKYLGKLSSIPRIAIGSALGALPGAAIVIFVNAVFRPGGILAEKFPVIWAQVTMVGILIGTVEYIDWRGPQSQKPAPVRTKFHKRLPPELGNDIISLSMQDHYAEVSTTQDRHLVLIRLQDAIAELEGLAGLRIHRSHWVALGHLKAIERQGKKLFALLSDGRKLPVSASYSEAAMAALAA